MEGFEISDYHTHLLLGCDAVEFSKFVSRLGRNLLRLSCRQTKCLKGQLIWS